MKIEWTQIEIDDFGLPGEYPDIPKSVFEKRCEKTFAGANSDWVVVYGDREHFANLMYLTNFDPRFEEAILLLGANNKRVLYTGNEGIGYIDVIKPSVDVVLCQSFSLMGQDRTKSPGLKDLFREAGIGPGQKIAVIGWKYLEDEEHENPFQQFFVPAYIIDTLRDIVKDDAALFDATRIMIHPTEGLRTDNEAAQIAAFEWSAARVTASVLNIMKNAKPGMTELEAMLFMNYCGEPHTMHPTFSSGKVEINGLRSPGTKKLEEGDILVLGFGYRGGAGCRAGLFKEEDEDYLTRFAIPYYKGIATWYQEIGVGVSGDDIYEKITEVLAQGGLKQSLTSGHLSGLEEWLHSPTQPRYPGKLKSGMAWQSDIIPVPQFGYIANCEDPLVLADENLRKQLEESFPDVWARIQKRQDFMRNKIGINIQDDVLPLSSMPAYFAPLWLSRSKVLALV